MHLLVAPTLARVVLVEAGEIAVVALVERLIPMTWRPRCPSSSSIRSMVRCARTSAEV